MKKQRTDNFDKFANQKKGSAIKEEFRQQKKKLKQEARAAGEEMRRKKIEKQRGIRDDDPRDKKQGPGKPGKDTRNRNPGPERKKYQGAGNTSQRPQGQQERTRNNDQVTNPGTQPHPAKVGPDNKPQTGSMPLNKFISHSGICGRREAAELVKAGYVSVNGDKIFEPGYKVSGKDKVSVKGKQVFLQKNTVYILLNKPKDFITTSNDPQGRKTVMDLVKQATPERVYPVGRLDRNTTGVLVLTNDGELAQKLTHPSFEVKKIYEVTLDKPVAKKDLESILEGVVLEDGPVKADAAGYADAHNKHIVGIEIHSGRNRIVRRIFEHLGYDVKGLDRVMFANLTKKNVERGKWRFLNEKEVRLLKFMNKSFVRKSKESKNITTDFTD